MRAGGPFLALAVALPWLVLHAFSHARWRQGLSGCKARVKMGVVTVGAIIDLTPATPAFFAFAMSAILPVLIRLVVALGTNEIALIKVDRISKHGT
jgi:hypothetical protein